MRLAFWRRPEPPAPPPPAVGPVHGAGSVHGVSSVHPPLPVPAAADVAPMPPEVADVLRALWREDPVGVEVAAQALTGQGGDVMIRAEIGACGLLSQLLAEAVGFAPAATSLAPEVLARMQAHGDTLVQRAAPLLPRFAPGADAELARFCVTFASGALSFDADMSPLEDSVRVLRVACVLVVTSHRPAPLEDLLAKLAGIYR